MIDFRLEDSRLWFFRAYIERVIEGDCFIALLDKGLNDYRSIRLRLTGVDAPRVDPRQGSAAQRVREQELGLRARDRLAELIEKRELLLRLHKTNKRDKYTAEVFLAGTTESANAVLLREGLGVRFGSQPDW